MSIPPHSQGNAIKKLQDAWHRLNERPYPRKSSDPGVAALYDELVQVDEAMTERLRKLIAGQPVNRLDFDPPAKQRSGVFHRNRRRGLTAEKIRIGLEAEIPHDA